MIHAFLLFVFIMEDGSAGKRLVSNDLYFRSVDDCTYYAKKAMNYADDAQSYASNCDEKE